ncbi:MAG: roadblock/LC7 domain-containing protein [Methanoculleaceae archaeon]
MKKPVPLKDRIRRYIDEIESIDGVESCIIGSQDGITMGHNLADSMAAPSFGAMSATILASAEAATSVVHLDSPRTITVDAGNFSILIKAAGPHALIAAIIDTDKNIEEVSRQLAEIADRMGDEL